MYTLIVENENGEKLELTHNNNYDVLKIEGLNPPSATINTTTVVGIDGSKYNSSRIEQRNIVIYLNVNSPIEENRQRLYGFFRSKRKCKIYYKNKNRDVFIEGYVETFENDIFANSQRPQISIICPESFFNGINTVSVDFSNVNSLFEFPFAIDEEGVELSTIEMSKTKVVDIGDVETGAIFTFTATTDQILNPTIYNRTTSEYFGLDIDMQEGDVIIVNTNKGKKSASLLRDGVTTNILNNRRSGSKWIRFIPGENEISYDADEGDDNLIVNVEITQKYEGV